MHEFGEELLFESYKVPWLIWIQLLVTFLLLLLLFFGFSVFSLDLPDTSASTSFTAPSAARSNGCLGGGQSHRTDQEGDGIQCAERGVETSASRDAIRGEEMDNGSSSVKDAIHSRPIRHPCHFLGVAKQAFLNCLGLGSSSESRSKNRKHVKED